MVGFGISAWQNPVILSWSRSLTRAYARELIVGFSALHATLKYSASNAISAHLHDKILSFYHDRGRSHTLRFEIQSS